MEWYYKYITERHLTLESNEYEIKTCVKVGFFTAKFWDIAFDPAIEIINENEIFGQGFEDDCTALIRGEDLNTMTLKMNDALDNLVTWGATCRLRFNPSKMVLLHYKNN